MTRELIGVVFRAMNARRLRVAMMMLGPLLGVAAIVAVIGLTESAKGDVRSALRELGTNLIVVSAPPEGSSAGRGSPKLSAEAAGRVEAVSTVQQVAQQSRVWGVSVAASHQSRTALTMASLFEVWATDEALLSVAGLHLAHGRFFSRLDSESAVPVAVIGSEVAALFAVTGDGQRAILLDGELFGVVGVLKPARALPRVNRSVFVTYGAAAAFFGDPGQPDELLVRVEDGTTEATADILPLAITYGGPGVPRVRVPSDLLEASAQVDQAFRTFLIVLSVLALSVGAIGIANVMTISVMERSVEIGIRRALGHTRRIIATQFLMESAIVGLLGGVAGVFTGIGFVAVTAAYQDWVLVLNPPAIIAGGLLSVFIATLAGVYPALRAARLEPLETLRL